MLRSFSLKLLRSNSKESVLEDDDESCKASQSLPLSPKRLPAETKSLGHSASKEIMLNPEQLETIEILQDIIKDPKLRQELVIALFGVNSDAALRVRFISSVWEFQGTTDKNEKKVKGHKIVRMFVRNGSMFQCDGIPEWMQKQEKWGDYAALEWLKNQFEVDLARSSEVQAALLRIERTPRYDIIRQSGSFRL
jgi:hypothetical protein